MQRITVPRTCILLGNSTIHAKLNGYNLFDIYDNTIVYNTNVTTIVTH